MAPVLYKVITGPTGFPGRYGRQLMNQSEVKGGKKTGRIKLQFADLIEQYFYLAQLELAPAHITQTT